MSGLYIVNKPPVRMCRGWELSLRPSEPKRLLGVENKVTYGVASRERDKAMIAVNMMSGHFIKSSAGLSSDTLGGVTLWSQYI